MVGQIKRKIKNLLSLKRVSNLPNEPVQIDIAITERCCLKCKFCDCWKRKTNIEKELSIEEWKYFLWEVKKWASIKYLCIGGGEPFMKEGIINLLKFCNEKNIPTVVITNGFLMNDQMIKKVCDSGLQTIDFSLDEFEETHDKLRGKKGVFKKVVHAIGMIKEIKPNMPVGLCTMINGENLGEIIPFMEWVQQNANIDHINFQALERVVRYDGPLWYKKDLLWPKNINKINNVMDELIAMKRKGYKITNPISQFEVFKKYFANPQGNFKLYCKAGFSSIPVDSYGNITLCVKEKSVGNIKEDSIRKIYYSKIADKIRENSKKCTEKCHFLINFYYDERR